MIGFSLGVRRRVWRRLFISLFCSPLFIHPLFSSIPDREEGGAVVVEGPPAVDSSEPASSDAVSFLYVDGNESGAGGGHTALRIGNSVFHFQRSSEGFFVVERTPWDGFRFSYSRLQNRNIYETPIRLTQEQSRALYHRFTDLQVRHRWLLERRARLIRQRQRLEALRATGTVAVPVPVLGYFGEGQSDLFRTLTTRGLGLSSDGGANGGIAEPANVIGDSRGDVLSGDIVPGDVIPSDIVAKDVVPGDDVDTELTLERTLRHYLRDGFAFADSAFIETELPLPANVDLKSLESALWAALERSLSAEYRLRPDRARTSLEVIVLLESLRRSQQAHRVVVPRMALFADGSFGPQDVVLKADDPTLAIFLKAFLEQSGALAKKSASHGADVVTSYNRLLQSAAVLDLAMRQGALAVLSEGVLMPTPSLAAMQERTYEDKKWLTTHLERTVNDYDALESLMRNELGYFLLTRNCVTELLIEVEAVAKVGLPVQHPFRSGLFIPVLSESYVTTAFQSDTRIVHRSYRNDMLRFDGAGFAEVSTFTSSHYHFNDRDSWFIFFTEDRPAWRPVFGIVNLSAGLTQAVIGLPSAPFDRGQGMARGLRGTFFSLSEVVFISVRKGTFRGEHPTFYSFPSSTVQKKSVTKP